MQVPVLATAALTFGGFWLGYLIGLRNRDPGEALPDDVTTPVTGFDDPQEIYDAHLYAQMPRSMNCRCRSTPSPASWATEA